jgi:hypothetical protein
MKGLTFTILVWLAFVSVAPASLAPPKKSRSLDMELGRAQTSKVSALVQEQALPAESEAEFAVTAQTEILLDGQPCAYADVPASAGILRMEVAVDRKTVLKIHFRTKK